MENEPVFYDISQFKSVSFSTNLYPAQFLLFLLWSQNKMDIDDIDRLSIIKENPEETDEEKLYVIFRIGNAELKDDDFFGTYYRSPGNVHHLNYKRLFNKRFADEGFLELTEIYDTTNNELVGKLLKDQIIKVYENFSKPKNIFTSYIKVNEITGLTGKLGNLEKQKLFLFYHQSKNTVCSPGTLQQLLKSMLYINAEVDFRNECLEYNYNPAGIGLGDEGYMLGRIVLDNIVRYTDVVAYIKFEFQNNIKLDFMSKVDYIYKFNFSNNDLHISNTSFPADNIESKVILSTVVNNTKDNYVYYSGNGINVNFPSCISAYTIQLVKNKIELLHKFQNDNNYLVINISNAGEAEIARQLHYSIDPDSNLSMAKNLLNTIIANHTVRVKVFISDEVIRIETRESVIVNMGEYYKKVLASQLKNKINTVLDVLLPAIYERKTELK